MRRLCTVLVVVAVTILSQAPALTYTLQYTDASTKTQIKWPNNRINLSFSSSLNTPPPNVKAGSDVVGALRRALSSWSEAADIEFVESWSKEQSVSAAGGKGDGISLITIADTVENTAPFVGAASDMSGRTRVFFTKTGSVTEADIVLNPYQLFSTDGTSGTYDIEATFAHEIGHLLGLEHSSVVGATMQPRQGRNGIYGLPTFGPRTLSQDDVSGISAIYGVRPEKATARGSITGTISNHTGAPAFGVSVWAEESTTGRLAASSITLTNGTFQIDNLAPGRYDVKVESLDGVVLGSEIASQRGAYTSLASSPVIPFRTQEIGGVTIVAERTVTINAQLLESPAHLNATLIGFNGQLSTLAVPLTTGRTYTVYVGGDGVTLKQLAAGGISIASRYLSINPASIAQQQFGAGLSVISFDVTVGENALEGDYSVRLQSQSGEVAYVVGGISVVKESSAGSQ